MKTKRIIPVFFILILSLFQTLPFIESAGYGEENENLGQFTDDFENDNNVSVAVNVIRNSTLHAMELNQSVGQTVIYNLTRLREHDRYVGLLADVSFSIVNNDELRLTSTLAAYDKGYAFFIINSAWLDDKYVRFRWYPYSNGGPELHQYFQVYFSKVAQFFPNIYYIYLYRNSLL